MTKKQSNLFKEALHYVLLVVLVIFVAHSVSDITGIEGWAIDNGILGMVGLGIYYLIWLVIVDQALHKALKI